MHGIGGEIVAKFLMQLLRLNKLNKYYNQTKDAQGIDFINSVISVLELKYEVTDEDLKKIPQEGAFITVSNHPYGGIDGLLLIKILSEIRPDYKIFANFLLRRLETISDYFFANPFENQKETHSSIEEVKSVFKHLEAGNGFGIFPAGEVSTIKGSYISISDRQWQRSALKFIKKAEVPVIPVYFQGSNSRLFHILGRIHPVLRTARLPSELFNKKKKIIKIRIGSPINVREQNTYTDIEQFGRFLRAKTYSLGTKHEVKKYFRQIKFRRTKKVEDIAAPIANDILEREINAISEQYELFQSQNFNVLCAPSFEIPNLLNEIGRLREITFREIGEGTNRSLDLDEYDLYYNQLIIWDQEAKKIVGAYRVGLGNDILAQYGKNGFYLQSLFRISKKFVPYLNESLELGRSFIVKEYQRKPLSLFLLWKGILYFLLKHTEYRYLIGPVSISNEFSDFSKSLIVDFCKKHLYNQELAQYIKPKKRFKVKEDRSVDKSIFINDTEKDLEKLDTVIRDIESGLRTPVLLKKYIKLNARLLGFNIDPKFNNCLDGFIVLDIYDVPPKIVKSLSKELDDDSILERFNFK